MYMYTYVYDITLLWHLITYKFCCCHPFVMYYSCGVFITLLYTFIHSQKELSGKLSDKTECTFKPKISKAAKELVTI